MSILNKSQFNFTNLLQHISSRLLFLFLIFCTYQNASSQNNQNNFGLDVGGWSLYDGEQIRLYAGLSHEWKVLPMLGIELNASAGTFDKYSEWYEPVPEQINVQDIDCKYQTLGTKFNGYLNLKYDEKDIPLYYLFASFGVGASTIQTKGTLKTFEGKVLKGEAKYSPHMYTKLEFGFGGKIGERVHTILTVGRDNIPFEDAIAEMDKDAVSFPMKFSTYMTGAYFQLTFKYFYKKDK
jgi:hypothetical protein